MSRLGYHVAIVSSGGLAVKHPELGATGSQVRSKQDVETYPEINF